ncbi:hypothetical protein ACFSQJ_15895 [Croceitalea marina]|uniref:Fibronectin type-III domain-containing protein n=1 Tax=Croceitalea marina TaxID=1775166 RepID=A0ABW5MZT3_9FLAO
MILKNIYKISSLICFSLVISSCSSSSSGGSDDTPPPPVVTPPSAVTLVFPENNTECNEGVVSSTDITKSTVNFQWNASQNTDSYTVNLRNLNTNASFPTNSTTTSAQITIDRGTPYEWSVTSRATGVNETATSSAFKFFNEGPGIESHAPFPAEAISPSRGANLTATTTVNLEWEASDVDNDIASFEVFFGTETNPTTLVGNGPERNLDNIAVTSGTTYYWKIITSDRAENKSTSEIFQFRVN